MRSRDEEIRNAVLEADPDGIEWKHESTNPGPQRATLSWLDAMLSLFTELEGFRLLVGQRVKAHIARLARNGRPIDGQAATESALLEVLGELAQERDAMIREALRQLREAHDVPREQLVPQLVGQDWSQSSLTSKGVLDLRARFFMRRAPHVRVELERRRLVWIPRETRSVRVRAS